MFAIVSIAIFGLLGNLVLLSAHYWIPLLLKRDAEPPESYVWGTALGILAPFLAWLGFWWAFEAPTISILMVMLGFCVICGLAGLGTILAYALDYRHRRHLSAALWASKQERLAALLASRDPDAASVLAEIKALFDEPRNRGPH